MKRNKTLITGGLGFIGSNYIDYILETKPQENLLVLDNMTYAADPNALKRWEDNKQLNFIKETFVMLTFCRRYSKKTIFKG